MAERSKKDGGGNTANPTNSTTNPHGQDASRGGTMEEYEWDD